MNLRGTHDLTEDCGVLQHGYLPECGVNQACRPEVHVKLKRIAAHYCWLSMSNRSGVQSETKEMGSGDWVLRKTPCLVLDRALHGAFEQVWSVCALYGIDPVHLGRWQDFLITMHCVNMARFIIMALRSL